ncbi:hypothetical protein J6590_070102, partial [Homalodisca vitripennis]
MFGINLNDESPVIDSDGTEEHTCCDVAICEVQAHRGGAASDGRDELTLQLWQRDCAVRHRLRQEILCGWHSEPSG